MDHILNHILDHLFDHMLDQIITGLVTMAIKDDWYYKDQKDFLASIRREKDAF